jgi:hypothetical protein
MGAPIVVAGVPRAQDAPVAEGGGPPGVPYASDSSTLCAMDVSSLILSESSLILSTQETSSTAYRKYVAYYLP